MLPWGRDVIIIACVCLFVSLVVPLEYSLDKYCGQVWWWVPQLIRYGYNWMNFCYVLSCLHINSQTFSLSISWMQSVIIMNRWSFNHWFFILITCPANSSNQMSCSAWGWSLDYVGRMAIYNSFIISNFNYCPVVWMFTYGSFLGPQQMCRKISPT